MDEHDLVGEADRAPCSVGIARLRWDGGILADAGVVHLCNEGRIAGRWFAENEDFYLPVAWDIYYLYGPDATWEEPLSPLVISGSPIIGRKDRLRAELLQLVEN